jgi:hypothetical protein
MASRALNEVRAVRPGLVHVTGSFKPNGTGVPVVVEGKGFSVARAGTGSYTLTFDDPWVALNSVTTGVRVDDAVPTMIQCGAYVNASKTLNMKLLRAGNGTSDVTATLTTPKGNIALNPQDARSILSTAVPPVAGGANTGSGGVLGADGYPSLARVNGATDPAFRIGWAATQVVPIQWDFQIPADLDNTANATVKLWFAKGSNTDTTAVVGVGAFQGVGDTDFGGNTAALGASTLAVKSVTLVAADLPTAGGFMSLVVTPGTHANDAIYCYGGILEYTRQTWAVSTTGSVTGLVFAPADLSLNADRNVDFDCVMRNTVVT